jgi:hypothetical protein
MASETSPFFGETHGPHGLNYQYSNGHSQIPLDVSPRVRPGFEYNALDAISADRNNPNVQMRPDDRPLTIPEGPGAFVTLAEKRAAEIRRGALDVLQNSAAYPDAILRDLAHKGGLANYPAPQQSPKTPFSPRPTVQ